MQRRLSWTVSYIVSSGVIDRAAWGAARGQRSPDDLRLLARRYREGFASPRSLSSTLHSRSSQHPLAGDATAFHGDRPSRADPGPAARSATSLQHDQHDPAARLPGLDITCVGAQALREGSSVLLDCSHDRQQCRSCPALLLLGSIDSTCRNQPCLLPCGLSHVRVISWQRAVHASNRMDEKLHGE